METKDRRVDRLFVYLAEQVKLHGLPFILFTIAVWYFYTENAKMTAELQRCNEEIVNLYREHTLKMHEALSNNTRAMIELKETIGNR